MLKKNIHIFSINRIYFLLVSACLFIISFITQITHNTKYIPEVVEHKLQRSINKNEKDFYSFVQSKEFEVYCNKTNTADAVFSAYEKPYGIFVYAISTDNHLSLKKWSNNKYHINERDISMSDSNYVVYYQNGIFEIIRKKIQFENNSFIAIGIIPIQWDYFIKNKYLETSFSGYDKIQAYYEVNDIESSVTLHSINGKTLFGLKKIQQGFFFEYDIITIFFRFLGLLFLFIFINEECASLINKIGFKSAFALLIIILTSLRISAYFVSFPFDYSKLPLFDPSVVAATQAATGKRTDRDSGSHCRPRPHFLTPSPSKEFKHGNGTGDVGGGMLLVHRGRVRRSGGRAVG